MTRCPTPTRCPTVHGTPSSTWTTAPSWTLDWAPSVIWARSPRRTAWYHTLDSGPRLTDPMTEAPGAMKAVGWMIDMWAQLSAISWGSSRQLSSDLQRNYLIADR